MANTTDPADWDTSRTHFSGRAWDLARLVEEDHDQFETELYEHFADPSPRSYDDSHVAGARPDTRTAQNARALPTSRVPSTHREQH